MISEQSGAPFDGGGGQSESRQHLPLGTQASNGAQRKYPSGQPVRTQVSLLQATVPTGGWRQTGVAMQAPFPSQWLPAVQAVPSLQEVDGGAFTIAQDEVPLQVRVWHAVELQVILVPATHAPLPSQ